MVEIASAIVEAADILGGNERFHIDERTGLTVINLRGKASVQQSASRALNVSMPVEVNTYASATGWTSCWMAPDEVLIISEVALDAPAIIDVLERELVKNHFAITDQSSGYCVLRLSGSKVRDVLQRGTTLDVHPLEFTQGQCAQTALEKMPVLLIARQNDAQTSIIDLVVRRSYADYCLRWLVDAAFE